MGWNVKKINYDLEYLNIISSIDSNPHFKKIIDKKHHGKSRYLHSKRVSYLSYKIARFLHLDYQKTAKAGLLHDYFIEENNHFKDKLKSFFKHSSIALDNSKKIIYLSPKEENIIASHMFPLSKDIPLYLESIIVNVVDKTISIEELTITTSNYLYYKAKRISLILFILINLYKK